MQPCRISAACMQAVWSDGKEMGCPLKHLPTKNDGKASARKNAMGEHKVLHGLYAHRSKPIHVFVSQEKLHLLLSVGTRDGSDISTLDVEDFFLVVVGWPMRVGVAM